MKWQGNEKTEMRRDIGRTWDSEMASKIRRYQFKSTQVEISDSDGKHDMNEGDNHWSKQPASKNDYSGYLIYSWISRVSYVYS